MPSLHSGGQYEICNAAASRGDCAHWAPMRCRWDQDAELFEGAGRRGFVLVILVMSAVNHTAFFFPVPGLLLLFCLRMPCGRDEWW